jgi:hypothetical protein
MRSQSEGRVAARESWIRRRLRLCAGKNGLGGLWFTGGERTKGAIYGD